MTAKSVMRGWRSADRLPRCGLLGGCAWWVYLGGGYRWTVVLGSSGSVRVAVEAIRGAVVALLVAVSILGCWSATIGNWSDLGVAGEGRLPFVARGF